MGLRYKLADHHSDNLEPYLYLRLNCERAHATGEYGEQSKYNAGDRAFNGDRDGQTRCITEQHKSKLDKGQGASKIEPEYFLYVFHCFFGRIYWKFGE
jgi:hypothetical protein